jgi:L-ascorbate metabolism protein UlaG (beta-lactamase superfamily)
MKNFLTFVICLASVSLYGQELEGDKINTDKGDLIIRPVQHGSFVMKWDNLIIYVDPYGGEEFYNELPAPDVIIITDIHGDHMNKTTLEILDVSKASFIVPKAVEEQLDEKFKTNLKILNNGESVKIVGFDILAIPMYNLPESEDSRHTKGRGNGYVLTIGGKKVYISGDTEDIPEMRALRNIDIAFVCMNQPFTMEVEQAADAVLEFKPAIVYPYHFRGREGLSDVNKFESLVKEGDSNIEVRLREWYKPQN